MINTIVILQLLKEIISCCQTLHLPLKLVQLGLLHSDSTINSTGNDLNDWLYSVNDNDRTNSVIQGSGWVYRIIYL